jgi:hypothetical protein
VTGQIRMSQRVPLVRSVALAIWEILQDRRNRVLFSIVRQPDAGRQHRTVFQRYQSMLDDPHSSREGRDNHRDGIFAIENSRASFVDQAQDQGIKAVGPGAGRDNYDQHEGIKRLR